MIFAGNKKAKLFVGNRKVRKAYLGTKLVYSAGNICTYIVGSSRYQEEVEEGESVLNPKTFTPPTSLSGNIFAGWSDSANGAILSYKVMGENPITLYARYVAPRIRNFGYTGGMQAFTAPYKGLYLFTLVGPGGGGAWSRAGDETKSTGGNGGKTTVYFPLNQNETVYVGVGGGGCKASSVSSGAPGGWNGGAAGHSSGDALSGGGAGATHVGRSNAALASTAKGNVIGVAGGGGGAAGGYPNKSSEQKKHLNGGYGGGLNGGNSEGRYPELGWYGRGGSQTAPGSGEGVGSGGYGVGGGASSYGGGGGAGLYGGSGGGQSGAGAGGSGYVYSSVTTYKGVNYSNVTTANAGAAGQGYGTSWTNVPPVNNGYASVDAVIIEPPGVVSCYSDLGTTPFVFSPPSGSNLIAEISKRYTPTKPGWTFLGWRSDVTPSASVITSQIYNGESLVLYAVWTQDVTLKTYVSGSLTSDQTKTRYYNQGNIANPTFTVTNPSVSSGREFRGWTTDQNAAVKETMWATFNNTPLSASVTAYALSAPVNTTITSGYGTNNIGKPILIGDEPENGIYLGGHGDDYPWNRGGTVTILSGINCAQYMGVLVPIHFQYEVNTNCSQTSVMSCGGASDTIFSGSRGNETTSKVEGAFTKTVDLRFAVKSGSTNLQFSCSVSGSNPWNETVCRLLSGVSLIHRPTLM